MGKIFFPASFPVSGSISPILGKSSYQLALTIWARSCDDHLCIELVPDLGSRFSLIGYAVFHRTPITKGPLTAYQLSNVYPKVPEGLSLSTDRQLFGSIEPQRMFELFFESEFSHCRKLSTSSDWGTI